MIGMVVVATQPVGQDLLKYLSGLASALQAQVDPVREGRTVRDSQRVPGVPSRGAFPQIQELMEELGLEDGLVRLARVGDEQPLAVEMVEGPVVRLSGEQRSHPGGALDGSGHNSLVSVSPIGP
ncbi:hypothetical protein ABTY00_27015 [Streptomyces microflavus]|uniref:hypothetical protein n=1 Tax=Streptomyces microflavus TaxID=1919 RepID=UPI0033166706